jgi:ADP-ribose pyrophosphatase YjhB (NUDIX family)
VTVDLLRHVNALVADLAAEHGRVNLIGRRRECAPAVRDAIVDRFESFGVIGGAGVRTSSDEGVLLVRYEEGGEWIEPGVERRPAESYRECAHRALADATGVDATLGGLGQVHLLYLDDGTGRQAVPTPYLVFQGQATDARATAGSGIAETRWVESPPSERAYAELAELSLPD